MPRRAAPPAPIMPQTVAAASTSPTCVGLSPAVLPMVHEGGYAESYVPFCGLAVM